MTARCSRTVTFPNGQTARLYTTRRAADRAARNRCGRHNYQIFGRPRGGLWMKGERDFYFVPHAQPPKHLDILGAFA